MRVIFLDVEPDNLMLATRAARWLLGKPDQKDAILAYGEGVLTTDFYVRRNKASVTVRRCKREDQS
mgnify:CR=1 FL=1